MKDEQAALFKKHAGRAHDREAADILEEEYGAAALKETAAGLLKKERAVSCSGGQPDASSLGKPSGAEAQKP